VQRDKNEDMVLDPDPEGNTRLAQQLCQAAKGSARLEGRDRVNDTDIAIAHRIAFDTLLPARAAALRAIGAGKRPTGDDVPRTTIQRALRDLADLGMITSSPGMTRFLTDAYRMLWLAAKLTPQKPQ
jgi:hypothetical protein